ncbi:MAG: deoxynucleoside kinase [Nitrospinaceae bacterium]|jgi:deoxyguanosine kinase|tara:strand:+ start:161 stop:811 length:651 start_codon:yes stop_codon:yes gene_type:complete
MTQQALDSRFIAIEGCIGAGKTSLVNLLGKQFDAQVVRELDSENPFINKFYQDRDSFGFQTQVFFLLNRYKQYMGLSQRDLFSSVVLVDYLFHRDRLFASLNLKDQELKLYDQIYSLLSNKVPTPDLVIFLQASTDILRSRVEKRGREYEAFMDPNYLDSVNKLFNNYFFYYAETPLLVINTNEIDFVDKKCDLDELIIKINNHKIGREYYNPLGS